MTSGEGQRRETTKTCLGTGDTPAWPEQKSRTESLERRGKLNHGAPCPPISGGRATERNPRRRAEPSPVEPTGGSAGDPGVDLVTFPLLRPCCGQLNRKCRWERPREQNFWEHVGDSHAACWSLRGPARGPRGPVQPSDTVLPTTLSAALAKRGHDGALTDGWERADGLPDLGPPALFAHSLVTGNSLP